MPKGMIINVGTGKERKDIAHAICVSIRNQNPDFVYFMVTKRTLEETYPYIKEDPVFKGLKWSDIKEIEDENDLEKIFEECKKVIYELIKKGCPRNAIVADFTAGTKAMSAGLVLAAIEKKIGILVYTVGERNHEGRVITGTERIFSFEPNKIYVEELLKEAISSFNKLQFSSCIDCCEKALSLIQESNLQNKLNFLKKLATAYAAWDRFLIKESFEILCEISQSDLPEQFKIKRNIELNKNILHKEKENNFCFERAVDLIENARRRGEIEKKYDDGVARLYRALEYIAQVRIKEKNLYKKNVSTGQIDTEDIDVELLPDNLKNKYRMMIDKDGKLRLGLSKSYELLNDCGDEVGKIFCQMQGTFKKLLAMRNNSILAHGFNSISENNFREIFQKTLEFVQSVFPETEEMIKNLRFPQIKID